MKKTLKYFLISWVVLLCLLSTVAGLLYYNINKVKQFALMQLNKQLTATITANDIDISFYKTFPKVSLQLKNVTITDFTNDSLLNAENIFLGFDVMQVIKGKYDIGSIKIENGKIKAYVLKNGNANFNILKQTDTKTDTASAFKLQLRMVVLNNIELIYINHQLKQLYHLDIENCKLAGNFSEKSFFIETNIGSSIKEIRFGKQKYFSNMLFKANTKLQYFTDEGLLKLANTAVQINNLKLLLNGNYKSEKKGVDEVNINIHTEKINIADLVSILPIKLPNDFEKYKSKGNVFVNGMINGKVNKPLIEMNFGIENGELTEPETKVKLSNIEAKGYFTNHKQLQLKINSFLANLGNNPISCKGFITDFDNLNINLYLSGKLNITDVVNFTKIEYVQEAQGEMVFDLQLSGQGKQIIEKGNNTGSISIQAPLIKLKDQAVFKNIHAEFLFRNNLLEIKNGSVSKEKTDINIHGTITDWQQIMLTEPTKSINVNLEAKVNELYLNEWFLKDDKYTNNKIDKEKNLPLKINIKLDADAVKYNNFMAERALAIIKGEIDKDFDLDVELKSLNTCKGSMNGSFYFNFFNNRYYFISDNFELKNINISELFKSFDNFGQDVLKSNHIGGVLNTSAQFVIPFNSDFSLRQNNIKAFADIRISNGKLTEFKPLYALSKFIKLSELQQINFAELKNNLVIDSGILNIPKMDIKSSAINLKLSGSHTFENMIDYNIELKLSELLKRKRSKEDNEYGEEDDNDKGLNLFIKMTGNAENPQIKYHTKAVKQKIKQSISEEKKNIVEIFKNETGLGKKDTTNKIPEKKRNQNENEIMFDKD